MTTKHDCSKDVWHKTGFYHCQRPATIECDGKWYCWQHDPERVKAEAKKHRADWEAKMDREAAKYERIARNARLGALVTPELAILLIGMANIIEDRSYPKTAQEARAFAARIREALALEVNDGKTS